MKCPNCQPPHDHQLEKTGWETPEYKCRFCKKFFDEYGKIQDPHEPKKPASGLVFSHDEWHEYYEGMW